MSVYNITNKYVSAIVYCNNMFTALEDTHNQQITKGEWGWSNGIHYDTEWLFKLIVNSSLYTVCKEYNNVTTIACLLHALERQSKGESRLLKVPPNTVRS